MRNHRYRGTPYVIYDYINKHLSPPQLGQYRVGSKNDGSFTPRPVDIYFDEQRTIAIFPNNTPYSLEQINDKISIVKFSDELFYPSDSSVLVYKVNLPMNDNVAWAEVSYLAKQLAKIRFENERKTRQ